MRWFRLIGSLLVATSLLGQQEKAAPSFRITGVVVNAQDRSPVRRCSVTARLVDSARNGPRDPAMAETDENGRFSLEVPSAGNWEVTASAHNIRAQPLDEHEGFFTGVILTKAMPVYDLVFSAVPDASLQGSVTDEGGEPVRNAQVALFTVDPTARQTGGQPVQQHQGTQTDDRGHYEIAGLDPGQYLLEVQARPWYASSNTGPRITAQTTTTSPDPSLDLVYAATWYPGVVDSALADVLTARPGERLQADFRLSPIASAHLLIPAREPQAAQANRPGRNGEGPQPFRQNPSISMLLPNGVMQPVFGQFLRNDGGNLDIAGLAPGTYQVTMPGGPDSPGSTTLVRVASGGSTEVGAPTATTPVSIAVDGGTNVNASQVSLRSTVTGQVFPSMDRGFRGPGPQGPPPNADRGRQIQQQGRGAAGSRGRPGSPPADAGPRSRGRREGGEVSVQIPPGIYEVGVLGDSSTFVSGVSAKGASAIGRTVTISDSPISLTVHLASGLALVEGTAAFRGKAAVGAMVLLVPATLGDPTSLTVVRRDQTNSDGSFRLDRVIPGQYILLAIDHGWGVRWTNAETLGKYLMEGTPLDLRSGSRIRQTLAAAAP